MKARVKKTGEIIELYRFSVVAEKGSGVPYTLEQLEFEAPFDYWTRLEHTYAGMAMQGLLSSGKLNIIMDNSDVLPEGIAIMSREFAHALVEKLKNE